MKKAILLSGGIDSCCLAYWLKPEFAIFINYGQRPAMAELRASQAIANAMAIPMEIIDIDCSSLGSGDLSAKRKLKMAPVSEWWPFRNQMLITFGLMKSLTYGINELLIGSVKSDNKHRDGSNDFFKMMNSLSIYQEGNIKVSSPAIGYESHELISVSKITPEILGYTHSCHKSNIPCGKCNGCLKHIYTKQKSKLFN